MTVIRKKGKLPRKAACVVAPNEYAVEHFEMHEDGVAPGQRVLIVDDLIATGGTVRAAADLLKEGGAEPVGVFAVIGLPFLDYATTLGGLPSRTLIEYYGE